MNPLEIIGLIKNGSNPEQIMMSFLEDQLSANPVGANLLSLAKAGKTNQIESVARNLCKESGIDYDKEFTNFRQQLGL